MINRITRKSFRKALSLVLSVALTLSGGISPMAEASAGPKLNKKKLTLKVGEKFKLKVKKADKNAKITWKSSKPKVASVSKNGKVTAKKAGSTKIKVKVKSDGQTFKLKCKVKVESSTSDAASSSVPIPVYTAAPVSNPASVATPSVTPQIIYLVVTNEPGSSDGTDNQENSVTSAPGDENGDSDGREDKEATETKAPNSENTATPESTPNGNVTYQGDVTKEMTDYNYWADKCEDADEVLISAEEIEKVNKDTVNESGTMMYDLLNQEETYDGDAKKSILINEIDVDVSKGRLGDRTTIYLDGEPITGDDLTEFFENIKSNIRSAETTTHDSIKYALCTDRAELKMAPVFGSVGWSATDPDDEFINSAVYVNEPFIVDFESADGAWYHGFTSNCSGWVPSDCFAICSSKDEWKSMWYGSGEDFLYVTTGNITLATSNLNPEISELHLTLGTKLPLVPKDELVDENGRLISISERGIWYNYVVYVPTRDENGNFVKSLALIDMKEEVNAGELPFTKRNVLKVAFNCLGDRYGWGGSLNAMDCSLYTRSIYKCFGFELPRNTTWQGLIPTENYDLSEMTSDEKYEVISKCEPGTLLMFSGHITMYIGEDNGKLYVISDLGSLAEAVDVQSNLDVMSMYCVSINSVDVRRRDGSTWLENFTIAIRPFAPLAYKQKNNNSI